MTAVARGKVVRDGRRLGFFCITKDATAVLRAEFPKRNLATARSVYFAFVEKANDLGTDSYAAERRDMAALAGVHPNTLTEYATKLVAAGLLLVETREEGSQKLPSIFTLVEPDVSLSAGGSTSQGDTPSVTADDPSHSQGGLARASDPAEEEQQETKKDLQPSVADEEIGWAEWKRVALDPFGRDGTLSPPRVATLKKAIAASDNGVTGVMAAIRANVAYWLGKAPERLEKGATAQLQLSEVLAPNLKMPGTNQSDFLGRAAEQDPGPDWSPTRPVAQMSPEEQAAAMRAEHVANAHLYRSQLIELWDVKRPLMKSATAKVEAGQQADMTGDERRVRVEFNHRIDDLREQIAALRDALVDAGWSVILDPNDTVKFEAPTA